MTELWTPRKYHTRMVRRMTGQNHGGLLADPGAGKTAVTLEAFRRLHHACDVARMLVVAPPKVAISTWPAELAKWEQFGHLRMSVLHGPQKGRRLDDSADIFVCSTDGVKWLVEQKGWDLPEMLVVDEISKFKHPGTRRFRALRRLLPKFARRWGLTGTPSTNGLGDLWGQCFVIDRGNALGRTKRHYLEHYFVPVMRAMGDRAFYEWVPRRGAEQEILAKIAPLMERVGVNELDGMPELATLPIEFEMPAKAMRAYREFAAELVLGFDRGEVTAANSGVRSAKLRQLAGGRVYKDDLGTDRPVEKIHGAKQAALTGLLDELGGKRALIVYGFRHDITAVREALGYEVPVLGGGTTPAKAAELITLWNRGQLPHLLIYPCHGLNLQEGGHVLVWYTLPWDLELYQQMVGRLYRQGQKDRVLNYQLIAQGTVDRRVAAALDRKGNDQSRLLSGLRHDLQEMLR